MSRSSGVLLSVTSLPSKYGIGCFSKEAYDFVDWLAKAGQTWWQILPLGPTCYGPSDDSPYQSYSAFAGNPYMISLETLIKEGVLSRKECDALDFGEDPARVNYDKLYENRLALLHKAYERSNISQNPEYQKFLKDNNWWLQDYALFMALKDFFGGVCWTEWPQDIRLHWGFALDYYREKLYFDVEFQQYLQFTFFRQWLKLKDYANEKGIQIIGDMPIYVSLDSSDVWAHPELFQLDESNTPTAIAGCPPDAFSADGQVWGNPLYRWDYHKQTGYDWWVSRLYQSFRLYDAVRIDHFRGMDEYFSIPYGAKTAKDGHWEPGPGMSLFNTVKERLGEKQLIAEDLGHMTDTVRKLVKDSGFPNMKVIQFGFDVNDLGKTNDYLPHNYDRNCVVYTGTHDNETIAGWWKGLKKKEKQLLRDYLDDNHTPDESFYRSINRMAMASAANICILPLQDVLGLDNSARMNQPSTVKTNWRWRMSDDMLTKEAQKELLEVTKRYGRFNWLTKKEK
ncbi:MAG: 4-alpha-glucanotransferase [Oscillospiraceae bacterium]|nr:4-alpha-glucanotransferase [Oscillospiraceae bacterium]